MCIWPWKLKKPWKGKIVVERRPDGGVARPRKPGAKIPIADPEVVAERRKEVETVELR